MTDTENQVAAQNTEASTASITEKPIQEQTQGAAAVTGDTADTSQVAASAESAASAVNEGDNALGESSTSGYAVALVGSETPSPAVSTGNAGETKPNPLRVYTGHIVVGNILKAALVDVEKAVHFTEAEFNKFTAFVHAELAKL